MKRPPPIPETALIVPPPLTLFTATDLRDLRRARRLLERPSFTARLAATLGRPIEKGIELLPRGWSHTVHRATRASLMGALEVAVSTMGRRAKPRSADGWHKLLVGASGGLGGAFGLALLPIELPVSTTIMLRSIADIARSEGHNVRDAVTKLNCLQVFAFGGTRPEDDSVESSYWAVRAGLAKAITEAATALTERGVLETSAPTILRFISRLAARFGVVVSEQVAAKAVPVVGAAGGSLINLLFIDHFQDMARGHFIVRRLERHYGSDPVRDAYLNLR